MENKDKINIELELGDITNIIEKLKEDRATDIAAFILTLACSVICLLASFYFNLTDATFIRNVLLAIFGIGTVASCFVAVDENNYNKIIRNYEIKENKLLDKLEKMKNNEQELKEEKIEESEALSFTNNTENVMYFNNTEDINSISIKRERVR